MFNQDTLACDRPENVAGECRTWYNETFLESIAPQRSPGSGGGVRLDQVPGRRVQSQRRKPPPPPPSIQEGRSDAHNFRNGLREPGDT